MAHHAGVAGRGGLMATDAGSSTKRFKLVIKTARADQFDLGLIIRLRRDNAMAMNAVAQL